MSPRVVWLADPEALDVSLVGAKAAGLARARRAGLAALDGFVVTLAASAEPLQLAATELARRGSGAARMTVLRSDLDETLTAEIAEAAAGLAEPLIARSSSALEGEGTWAGAFASLPELHRDEVPKALRSVWSGMFTLEALERFEAVGIEPGSARMGVLVQTELAPDCGGAAIVDELGAVTISAVKGSPRDLLAGWIPGVRATVAPDGSISGQEALELIGAGTLTEVAALAREAAGELDCNLTEWAVTGGAPVLLQVQRTPTRPAAADGLVLPAALGHPDARRLARLVIRFPGALGEELVLGWAAAPGFVSARPAGAPVAVGGSSGEIAPAPASGAPSSRVGDGAAGQPLGGGRSGDLLVRARLLAAGLAASAWGRDPAEAEALARSVLRRLRGDRPNESIEALGGLAAPDPAAAAEVLWIIERLGEALGDPHGVWYHTVDELAEIVAGRTSPVRGRVGRDRWEPFLAGVAALGGEARTGIGASGGIGAGRLVWVSSPTAVDHVRPRDVIVVQYPLPNFAPLLWDAAGLVALGGAPSAHLMEVARSLTVPAVVGCPVDDLRGIGAPGPRRKRAPPPRHGRRRRGPCGGPGVVMGARPRVGVIGLGVMGGAMSGHLVAAGFEVCGYDLNPAKTAASAARGVDSIADVAGHSDVVLLSLPSVGALDDVSAGLAAAAPAGLVAVEMGTLPLEAKQRAFDRLTAAGCDLLDAPVSGTGLQAADATLVVYSSGSHASFERAAPIFDVIGRRSYDLGEFGNGSRMKFVANLLVAVHTLAAAEAHALGAAAGLDRPLPRR